MTDIEYTLLSAGQYKGRVPVRKDIIARIDPISKSLGIPRYRVVDIFLESCCRMYEAGKFEIEHGTVPTGKADVPYTLEDYESKE